MGEASDDIKLTPGSEIEISRLPGYILQTKGRITNRCSFLASYTAYLSNNLAENFNLVNAVMGEVVSTVQSELLCRAYMYLYLGDDPFDKEAKEKFGSSLLHLF